jgi:hypothetical protein
MPTQIFQRHLYLVRKHIDQTSPLQIYSSMRLLNAETKQFEEFFDEIPPYAILSHTWGSNELTFKDMERDGYSPSKKIDGCCKQALKDRLNYVWVDTCCIDKSSSAELSEAINSMYTWYAGAFECYAYLSDVPPGVKLHRESPFAKSRWFNRGWTLQELIAPKQVAFYDEEWNFLGRKSSNVHDVPFLRVLHRITNIDVIVLEGKNELSSVSVARKMSWASHRTTTRVEDMAYSLLGLFGINMPLLYGEGARAFKRLQEEIIRTSDDESVFAWGLGKTSRDGSGSILASSALDFENSSELCPRTPGDVKPSHYTLTNKGLHIETSVLELPIEGGVVLAQLNCSTQDLMGDERSLALVLLRSRENDMVLIRHCATPPVLIPSTLFPEDRVHVYVRTTMTDLPALESVFSGLSLQSHYLQEEAKIVEFYPPEWLDGTLSFYLEEHPRNLSSRHQNILFLIQSPDGPNYVLWLEYSFARDVDPFKFLTTCLIPQSINWRAAFLARDKTLAEMIIESRGRIEHALDWHGILDLGNSELCFEKVKHQHGLRRNELWNMLLTIKEKEVLLE